MTTPSNGKRHSGSRTIIAALAGTILYAVLALAGDLSSRMSVFLWMIGGLWCIYAWVAWEFIRHSRTGAIHEAAEGTSSASPETQVKLIVFFALLYRAILLPTTPWLSDDLYRYLWDGRVLMHGINPYQWPPAAAELAHLRDVPFFSLINHPDIRTIYPPLLQAVFAIGQILGGGRLSLKIPFVLVDALVILLLLRLLRRTGRDPRQVLLYAWNPLPILEIAGSGHADVLIGVLFLMIVIQLGAARFRGAALAAAAGFLTKFTSVLILPFLWMRRHRRETVLLFIGVVFLAYAPFLGAGKNLFSGLFTFSAKWRFNDSIFALVYWPLERVLPDSLVIAWMFEPGWEVNAHTLLTRRIDLALLFAKTITGLAFLGWMAWLGKRFAAENNSLEGWGRLLILLYAGLLLLAPTFQPWYLLWILPLCAIWPHRSVLLLSGTVFLSYWILQEYSATGVWRENALVKWLEFTPVFILMLVDKLAVRRQAAGRLTFRKSAPWRP